VTPCQKRGTAPEKKDSATVQAPLAEHGQQRNGVGVVKIQAQGKPDGVKEPGGVPNGEITAFGVVIEVEKQDDQHPDAQQGNEQPGAQVFRRNRQAVHDPLCQLSHKRCLSRQPTY